MPLAIIWKQSWAAPFMLLDSGSLLMAITTWDVRAALAVKVFYYIHNLPLPNTPPYFQYGGLE